MSSVPLRGVLRGMDRECDLLAWKETVNGNLVYSRCRIVNAPQDIPDGENIVLFDGQTVPVCKRSGWWLMEFLDTGAINRGASEIRCASIAVAPALLSIDTRPH